MIFAEVEMSSERQGLQHLSLLFRSHWYLNNTSFAAKPQRRWGLAVSPSQHYKATEVHKL